MRRYLRSEELAHTARLGQILRLRRRAFSSSIRSPASLTSRPPFSGHSRLLGPLHRRSHSRRLRRLLGKARIDLRPPHQHHRLRAPQRALHRLPHHRRRALQPPQPRHHRAQVPRPALRSTFGGDSGERSTHAHLVGACDRRRARCWGGVREGSGGHDGEERDELP